MAARFEKLRYEQSVCFCSARERVETQGRPGHGSGTNLMDRALSDASAVLCLARGAAVVTVHFLPRCRRMPARLSVVTFRRTVTP